jgi:hypothetical protein
MKFTFLKEINTKLRKIKVGDFLNVIMVQKKRAVFFGISG